MNSLPEFLNREPAEWIDGMIPSFAPEADSLYDRRAGTVDIYTGIAYGHMLFHQDAGEPLYAKLSSLVLEGPPPERVLDIGCGAARIAYDCAPQLPDTEFACIDISKEMSRRAWQILLSGKDVPLPAWEYRGRAGVVFTGALRQDNVWVAQADALDLPFHGGSFDTVTAALLLCRVRDPWKALREMRRVLRPGGRLLLATPFAFNDPAHWAGFWPPEKLRELLTAEGLQVEQWMEGVPYEEIIDANGNSHRYQVTVCAARVLTPASQSPAAASRR